MATFKALIKTLLVILLLSVLMVTFYNHKLSKNNKSIDLQAIEYLAKSEINELYNDINKFKNKGVKLQAKVFNIEKYNKDIYLQASIDVDGQKKNALIAYYDANIDIQNDDIILIDGIIQGTYEGRNKLGTIIKTPTILALDIQEKTI